MLTNNYFNYKSWDFENPISTTMIGIIDLYDFIVFFLILILWSVIVVFCVSSYYVYSNIILNSKIILSLTPWLLAWHKNCCNRANLLWCMIKKKISWKSNLLLSNAEQFLYNFSGNDFKDLVKLIGWSSLTGCLFLVSSVFLELLLNNPVLWIIVIDDPGLKSFSSGWDGLKNLCEEDSIEKLKPAFISPFTFIVLTEWEWEILMTNVNYKLLSRIGNYRYSNLMAENFLLLPKHFRTTIINISVKAPYQPNLVLFFLGFNVHGYNPIPDIPPREPTIGDALRRRDEGYWWWKKPLKSNKFQDLERKKC